MSTSTASTRTHRPLFLSIARSESIKLRTVRSTFWCLGAMALLFFIGSVVGCAVVGAQWDTMTPADRAGINDQGGASWSLQGGGFAQLAIGVLGILAITAEYGSGSIRTTFASAPQRVKVMLSKASVLLGPVFVLALIAAFASFAIGQLLLKGTHGAMNVGLGDDGSLRMIFGCALYLAITAIYGLGIGLLVRHTGGAITVFVGSIFVLPLLILLIPSSVRDRFEDYLPSNAGTAIFNLHPDPGSIGPWTGMAVYALWAAALLAAGILVVKRRDA